MFEYWSGTFFTDRSLNNEQYIISNQIWKQIGQIMHDCYK